MNQPNDTEVRWRRLGNSVGLWVFLFAGVGLLTLAAGDQKIQQRMRRNHVRMTHQIQPGKTIKAESWGDQSTDSPYRYGLTGLRFVLAGAAVFGFGMLVFETMKIFAPTFRKPHKVQESVSQE